MIPPCPPFDRVSQFGHEPLVWLNNSLVGCPLIFVFKQRIVETSTLVERIEHSEKHRENASQAGRSGYYVKHAGIDYRGRSAGRRSVHRQQVEALPYPADRNDGHGKRDRGTKLARYARESRLFASKDDDAFRQWTMALRDYR